MKNMGNCSVCGSTKFDKTTTAKHNTTKPYICVLIQCNVYMASPLMLTSSNGNIFRVTGLLSGHRWIPQRPVMRSFDVFFDLCLNKRLSKQPWGWWFETRWRSLWRHCNVMFNFICRTSYGFAKNICYISSLLHMLRRLMKTCLVSYSYFSSDFFLNVEQTEPRHWSYLVDELWQEMCLYHRDMLSLVRLSFFW